MPPEPPPKLFEILKVDARVTEANASWSRYAWKLTIRSFAATSLKMEARIEFQDKEGFVIADHVEYNLMLRANEQDTFTGYSLINASVRGDIATVAAKVKAT